jgi:hypothetical protein
MVIPSKALRIVATLASSLLQTVPRWCWTETPLPNDVTELYVTLVPVSTTRGPKTSMPVIVEVLDVRVGDEGVLSLPHADAITAKHAGRKSV